MHNRNCTMLKTKIKTKPKTYDRVHCTFLKNKLDCELLIRHYYINGQIDLLVISSMTNNSMLDFTITLYVYLYDKSQIKERRTYWFFFYIKNFVFVYVYIKAFPTVKLISISYMFQKM